MLRRTKFGAAPYTTLPAEPSTVEAGRCSVRPKPNMSSHNVSFKQPFRNERGRRKAQLRCVLHRLGFATRRNRIRRTALRTFPIADASWHTHRAFRPTFMFGGDMIETGDSPAHYLAPAYSRRRSSSSAK